MDPTDVLRTLWQQRWYVLPALLLTLAAAAYVYGFAPRSYEATSTYALVNPAVPTTEELERDPALAALNGDNPYLRSADTNLITDAVIARLGSASTVRQLEADGVGTDYGVGPGVGGTGFVVDITGVGPTPEAAIATATAVGTVLAAELEDLQRVNGADDRYLFTPLLLTPPDDATEQFSSRLRAVIIVLLGGAVLVFGAASLGRWRSGARAQRAAARAADAGSPGGPGAARETGPEPAVDEASGAAPGPTADATSRAASGPTASATSEPASEPTANATSDAASEPTASATAEAASEPAANTAAQAAPGPAAGATPESVPDPATDADEPTAAEPDAEPPTEPADPGPVATPRAPRAPRAAGRVPARAARGTGAPTARRPR